MSFAYPLNFLFILLLFIPPLVFLFFKSSGVAFPSINYLKAQNFSLRKTLFFLPTLCFFISSIFLIISLCEPLKKDSLKKVSKEGIAIEIVIDNSSSMSENILDGIKIKRKIDLVKEVVLDFVCGEKSSSRENDLIGLITFAKYANTIYPLTFNRAPFESAIATIDIATNKVDGTHFGAGLKMAIARLATLSEKEKNIKSKIIIFLTDGENRFKEIDPIETAKLAKENNIKIFTIAFSTRKQELLSYIAQITDGESFEAKNSGMLASVYEKIDKLEKSKLSDNSSDFIQSDPFKYIFSAIFFLALGLFFELTIFRRFP